MPPSTTSSSPVFAGIDLAWGQRARTGVAVASGDGVLLASTSVRTDAEITDFLEPYAAELAVVAVDAPLIVTNPTGQRPCEREIGVIFGRYGAGAHPANTSNPLFDPPRGATLAAQLGWNIDPAHVGRPGDPICLEVYPHPAMVGLFELPYTVPYKAKQGRDLTALKAAYAVLLAAMERHFPELDLTSNDRWIALRSIASRAQRKADLERIEDEIDAIVCAHLAWLWNDRPGALQVYGDVETGYIVAPPPPGHPAVRRSRARDVGAGPTQEPVG